MKEGKSVIVNKIKEYNNNIKDKKVVEKDAF